MPSIGSAIRRAVANGEDSTLLAADWSSIDHSEWRCMDVAMTDMHRSAVS
jgi:hypothetical protein